MRRQSPVLSLSVASPVHRPFSPSLHPSPSLSYLTPLPPSNALSSAPVHSTFIHKAFTNHMHNAHHMHNARSLAAVTARPILVLYTLAILRHFMARSRSMHAKRAHTHDRSRSTFNTACGSAESCVHAHAMYAHEGGGAATVGRRETAHEASSARGRTS